MKVAVIEPMGIIRDLFVPMSNESIMTLLNLKNSRFFTFSALNASFLSTQGKTLPIFGRVFALSGYRRLLPIIMG